MNINLRSPFLLTRLAIPHMQHRSWGRIIYISSIAATGTASTAATTPPPKPGSKAYPKT